MLIIIDKKMPNEAKYNLKTYGEVFEFETTGIVDDPISGHPDIFMCQTHNGLVIAPQAPQKLVDMVKQKASYVLGSSPITKVYPSCAAYNAVVTEKYLIHQFSTTEDSIIASVPNHQKINVKQGFTRCSLLPLQDGFITSDKGIYKKLNMCGCDILLVRSDQILLPGHKHGLFGGCCGIHRRNVFLCGDLNHHKDGYLIKNYLKTKQYQIIELYNGPLFDCGSFFFI